MINSSFFEVQMEAAVEVSSLKWSGVEWSGGALCTCAWMLHVGGQSSASIISVTLNDCINVQECAENMEEYARMCRKYARMCTNLQECAKNVQKCTGMCKKCARVGRNVQKMCKMCKNEQ